MTDYAATKSVLIIDKSSFGAIIITENAFTAQFGCKHVGLVIMAVVS